MEIPLWLNIKAAQYAKDLNKMVVLDCGGRDELIPQQLVALLDIVSPNETELLRLLDEKHIQPEYSYTEQKFVSFYTKLHKAK